MKKVLVLASVASMIDQFNMPNIRLLQEKGYEVHVACNFEKGNTCSNEKVSELKRSLQQLKIQCFQIDFARNITKVTRNINSYRHVLNLLKKNEYSFIHCHSPIGGVCGRIAAHKTKTKVIYTAHGFHFFKGAPLKNWLLYYPVERWLARYTDVLITINKEDFTRAKTFKSKKVEYVPGVGINNGKFSKVDIVIKKKREEIGLADDNFVILSVGELNKNKNHEVIIRAIAKLKNKNINYVLSGQGPLESYLRELIRKLGIKDQVHFLGFRSDIPELCKVADLFAFPSYREGLSLSLMEAMASGLPVVCSNIRGNTDLIEDGKGGYLVKPNDVDGFSKAIENIISSEKLRACFSKDNIKQIKKYSIENVMSKMEGIYFK